MRSLPFLAFCALIALPCPAWANGETPQFSRHVEAVFSRLGCNSGGCHGAVQGKNGFRLSLFGAKPEFDHAQITRELQGRRIDLTNPEQSLLLLKASGRVAHGGGKLAPVESREYKILSQWIASGAALDSGPATRIAKLELSPKEQVLKPGESYQLTATAEFGDGTREDVTALCSFQSLDSQTAAVDRSGKITAAEVGDVTIIVRYRDEPAMSMALVTRPGMKAAIATIKPHNFIDEHVLAKLDRLNIPPVEVCDDATFLRRVRLDITGELPTPDEVRAFLADNAADKRAEKIDQLLGEPGYAALWTLKFSDLLGAADFGIYADGLAEHYEAPRFQAWVRARMEENTPYDEFAARILLATSRDGRSLEEWSQEVIAMQEGYDTPRKDLEIYAKRKTLDTYWQRKDSNGVPGALQVAHTFLGLRLQCAQCHRHPHDVWQQDDLLSFANFFMRVRRVGFEGDNEKKYPEQAKLFKQFEAEGKKIAEEVKKRKEGSGKEMAEVAKKAQQEVTRLKNEIAKATQEAAEKEKQAESKRKEDKTSEADELAAKAKELRDGLAGKQKDLDAQQQIIADNDKEQKEIRELEKRGKLLGDEVAKRILHSEIFSLTGDLAKKNASVTSPLGTQSSKEFRLLGQKEAITIASDEDPRAKVVEWLRRPDNPFFAKAIVNRVWAHYFDRGLIDPPDDLSSFNPATHPALLDELCRKFIENKYDLKWLHRTIATSRTYQQSSQATAANQSDRTNYSHFQRRRLPAEVLLDSLNQVTGTTEDMGMKYYHWPEGLKAIEVPYLPQQNPFVVFVLEQFGRSERNSSAQCDCQRQSEASMLQVLTLGNHPRVWQKIADPKGRVAEVLKDEADPAKQIEALYLSTLSRPPEPSEVETCLAYLKETASPEKGLQGVMWSLLNTREFLLQH
jgi:hypothetical protein